MAELRPSGFPEYNPWQQLIFDSLQACIEENYKKFWYTHIHTPAVEKNSVLLSKNGDETGKQIFWLYGMAQGSSDLKEYGLHFDLTVPFARYTLDWENQLTFPFKRYQIQPVRRGERAQKGRYREFFQCDIDVIWKWEKTYLYYDAEIITTLWTTLENIFQICNIQDIPVFHISNKKIVKAFLGSITNNEGEAKNISNLIDKYSKIWEENFVVTLKEDYWISEDIVEKILTFIHFRATTIEELSSIENFCDSELYHQGIEELKKVINILLLLKNKLQLGFEWIIDFQIIRGLDYYTGTIFEAVFKDDDSVWSICWGGRYENLTGYIDPKKTEYCGVWGSIGISRILGKVFEHDKNGKQTISDYLFLNFEENFDWIIWLASTFSKRWEAIEIYPEAEKLWKQFGYADKKWIPYVVVYGWWEKEQGIYKIKNMKTWEEETHPVA